MKTPYLGTQSNNFDGVRLWLALIVFFSHLSALTKNSEFWIFEQYANADFAVKGFFAISGYLVTRSFLNGGGILEFFEKRIRRIYPAYLGALLLCIMVGLTTTEMTKVDFLASSETIRYIISNAIFLNFLQPTLPMVFEENPLQTMNGSLWTIKIEMMLYACIPLIVLFFRKFSVTWVFFYILILSVVWIYYFKNISNLSIAEELSRQFPGQLSYFSFGIFLAIKPESQKRLGIISFISLSLLIFINNPIAKLLIEPFAYSTIVLFLSRLKMRHINFGKYGDISYGIYLYHFPIIQTLIMLEVFKENAYFGVVLALSLTLIISIVSWHCIEKPFLKRTSYYVEIAQKNK